ncbi:hypothetical protein [Paraburkholderia franconis]|uniref:hypothetical protein n=1 Tax=Paraburkholderia franconis TaxID=2654983 RepID=UPI003898D753
MYCIDCRCTNEDETSKAVTCQQCGRHLLVRDHFSRLASVRRVHRRAGRYRSARRVARTQDALPVDGSAQSVQPSPLIAPDTPREGAPSGGLQGAVERPYYRHESSKPCSGAASWKATIF